jgi:putative copper export protein
MKPALEPHPAPRLDRRDWASGPWWLVLIGILSGIAGLLVHLLVGVFVLLYLATYPQPGTSDGLLLFWHVLVGAAWIGALLVGFVIWLRRGWPTVLVAVASAFALYALILVALRNAPAFLGLGY